MREPGKTQKHVSAENHLQGNKRASPGPPTTEEKTEKETDRQTEMKREHAAHFKPDRVQS